MLVLGIMNAIKYNLYNCPNKVIYGLFGSELTGYILVQLGEYYI